MTPAWRSIFADNSTCVLNNNKATASVVQAEARVFVLLEHTTADGTHWDLMLEAPGVELLPTWRLLSNPLTCSGPIPAQRIDDHRPLFLEYEGPLRENRGSVRRVDRGVSDIERCDAGGLRARLQGRRLRGWIEVCAQPAGCSCLFTADDAGDNSENAPSCA